MSSMLALRYLQAGTVIYAVLVEVHVGQQSPVFLRDCLLFCHDMHYM